jgi:cbb3-type cytochrome oxidase cytochrome c subunit
LPKTYLKIGRRKTEMKKKCYFCDATTYRSMDDFAEIGWGAYSVDRKKVICGCPKHKKELRKKMMKEFK